MNVTAEIVAMCADVAGVSKKKAERMIILGLKDMAGVCPPRFMTRTDYRQLASKVSLNWSSTAIVITPMACLFPTMGAAAKAGAHIVDVAIGSHPSAGTDRAKCCPRRPHI